MWRRRDGSYSRCRQVSEDRSRRLRSNRNRLCITAALVTMRLCGAAVRPRATAVQRATGKGRALCLRLERTIRAAQKEPRPHWRSSALLAQNPTTGRARHTDRLGRMRRVAGRTADRRSRMPKISHVSRQRSISASIRVPRAALHDSCPLRLLPADWSRFLSPRRGTNDVFAPRGGNRYRPCSL
jgi:hypothetical protein